jgi:hypothetical protein
LGVDVAQEFGLAAGRYCAFVESGDDRDRDRFVQELERHLVDLYSAAIDLPPGDADGPEAAPSMTSTEFRELERRLSEKLGNSDVYWFMFDPYDDGTLVAATLADDIAGIYGDLKDGFALLEAGGSPEGAVWEWRFGFEHHWGRHAAHALYAVHVLRHG